MSGAARQVLLDWRGMILRGRIVLDDGQGLVIWLQSVAPPAGARVELREAHTVRASPAAATPRWVVDWVGPTQDGDSGRECRLVRARA